MTTAGIQEQRKEWRKKGWSIPDLRGGKQYWFVIVTSIINAVGNGTLADMNELPSIDGVSSPLPLGEYYPFFRGIGLLQNQAGIVGLTAEGHKFFLEPTRQHLANILHHKYRLFGEVLARINDSPLTVEELDTILCTQYSLNWRNLSNTRRRMDWLEVLGLIEPIAARKWAVTIEGTTILAHWCLVSPEAVDSLNTNSTDGVVIPPAPAEIKDLLQQLEDDPEMQRKRNTYNIWVPSPNRIDNLRTILQFASERISRSELFAYISKEFSLKASSVDSMLPFLKASGLIEEVGRGVYVSTSAAKAWLETGNDLDFIRILHAHMRFIGEMIQASEKDIVRNDLYAKAKEYGLNAEKARWIAGFLVEAGLLEEPQYLHLKATPLGKAFILTLPLATPIDESSELHSRINEVEVPQGESTISELEKRIDFLLRASVDPMAESKQSGVAFEEAIARIFQFIGFDAKRIGGSGDTDVIVRWNDNDGKAVTAIVDGKSKSSGMVSHNDISDVAIETHKEKNNASYVAIVGPSFSGDTIKNHARKKGFSLITASELAEIARASQEVGLTLSEIALLFQVPNGLSKVSELISEKQRQLEIITAIIKKMNKEQEDLGVLSPRDLFLLLRDDDLSPSLEELLYAFDILSKPVIGILQMDSTKGTPENTLYSITNAMSSVSRLRSIANAVEKGMRE